jgi:adenylate cyclase
MQNYIRNSQATVAEPRSLAGSVLIVDDEEQNRCLLRDPLRVRGYQVDEAENGLHALQKISRHPPDVILLDVMMPEMDGFEVCRLLRKDAKTAHLPILMVTALSERGDRLLGIHAGASDFLNKPIDIQDVLLRVGNAVQAKRLFDLLQAEQEKSRALLSSILPESIADRMGRGEVNIADHHPDVTVLLADLVGFTTLSAHIGPDRVVELLNEIFSAFDLLVEKWGLEKIKTIGDAYMVAGGIPFARPDHTEAIAELALDLRDEVAQRNREYHTSIQLRIGIATGPVVAGVIGRKKFAYDLWGETVNTACRLEAAGQAGGILVTQETYERLKGKYRFEGSRRISGKDQSKTVAHYLSGRPELVAA